MTGKKRPGWRRKNSRLEPASNRRRKGSRHKEKYIGIAAAIGGRGRNEKKKRGSLKLRKKLQKEKKRPFKSSRPLEKGGGEALGNLAYKKKKTEKQGPNTSY